MAISQEALRELRRELTELRQCRKQIDTKIHGIELILSTRRAPSLEAGRKKQGRGRGVRAGASAGTNGSARRATLRKEIMDVLQQAPGSKGKEVTDLVSRKGFRVGGVTSLSKRVGHELSRLRRIRVIRKRRGGRYVIAAAAKPNGATERPGTLAEASAVL